MIRLNISDLCAGSAQSKRVYWLQKFAGRVFAVPRGDIWRRSWRHGFKDSEMHEIAADISDNNAQYACAVTVYTADIFTDTLSVISGL